MEQLDKWNKELENLESKRFKETDSELFNLYRKSLVDIKKRLYKYTEEYENLSFSNRLEVERYFHVAKEIDGILANAYPSIESTIKNHVTESAEQGYYGLWYGIEESQKINLAMPLINHDYIQNIVNQPVAGKRLSKRLYDNRDTLAKNVTNNIVEGLFAGKGYKYTAKRVSDQTEASYRQSLRIVRTESGRVQSTTNQQSAENAKALGIDMQKKWLSTLDKRTRRHHQELDGQTVDIEEEFTINGHSALGPRLFGVAEQDINCRCTTINIVNGITPEMRYDQENSERIPFQSYEEWLEGKDLSPKNDGKELTVTNRFEFMPLTNETVGNKERILTMIERSKELTHAYQEQTGINPIQLWKEKSFVDKKNPYDDEKAKFVSWLLDESGYSNSVPQIINDIENFKPIYRGINGYGDVTASNQVENFLSGKLQISGAKSSANGRGSYFATDKSGAEKALKGSDSEMISAYILNDAKMLSREALFEEKTYFKNHMDEFGEEAEFYDFITSKNSLMDKQDEIFAILSGYDGIDAGAIQVIFNRSKVGVKK